MTLNEQQASAVHSEADHLVVVASAGAGKTEVIVQRYLHYVQRHGFKPGQILAITYTNRAAATMKRRIGRRLREMGLLQEAQEAETGPIQTIHSFYQRILKGSSIWSGTSPEADLINDQQERIFDFSLRSVLIDPGADDVDIQRFRRHCAGRKKYGTILDLDSFLRDQVVREVIEPARSQNWTPDQLRRRFGDEAAINQMGRGLIDDWPDIGDLHKKLALESSVELSLFLGLIKLSALVWERYEATLRESEQLDFGLLERNALEKLEEPWVAERLRQQIKVVLLDEMQDATEGQFRLLKLLRPDHSMAVGDSKQSIYAFRGANVHGFDRMVQGDTVVLEVNYRSVPGVIAFVNDGFSRLSMGTKYESMAPVGAFDPVNFEGVELLESTSGVAANNTARFLASQIDKGLKPQETVVLTSTRATATSLQAALENHGVRSEAQSSSQSLFSRMEARDMANLLTCCVRPEEDFAFASLLHSPYVGLSIDSVIMLGQNAGVFNQLDDFEPVYAEDGEKLQVFLDWFRQIREYCDRFAAYEIINKALRDSPYFENLGRKHGGRAMIANARKLLNYTTKHPELPPLQMAERLRHLQNIQAAEPLAPLYDDSEPVIRIMTIHQSKGLEFPNVLVYGHDLRADSRVVKVALDFLDSNGFSNFTEKNVLHEKISQRMLDRQLEEKMRLLYVACTRAEKRLMIGMRPAKEKVAENKRLLTNDLVAPFLSVLDRHHLVLHKIGETVT